jgi:hypothetical protein
MKAGGEKSIHWSAALFGASALALLDLGCGKGVPSEVKPAVDRNLPIAVQVAESAAKLCPSLKARAPFQPDPSAAPPPPPSPAIGTALESDAQVKDVRITCSWPDPRQKTEEIWAGTSFPALKGTPSVPLRFVTNASEFAENTCKADAHNCHQIVVPSRYHASELSADVRVTRPTSDGGEIEVIVVIMK